MGYQFIVVRRSSQVTTITLSRPEVMNAIHPPMHAELQQALDAFAAAIKEIVAEARSNPQALHDAPRNLPVGRLDEVAAARRINAYLQGQGDDPVLRWKPAEK